MNELPVDLRLLRLSRRLTQADVARAMGRSRQRAQAIETAWRPTAQATIAYLRALAAAAAERDAE